MSARGSSPAEQEAVARAWVESAGLAGLDLTVHPHDEMQAFLARISDRDDAHRFEYLRSGYEAFAVFGHALTTAGVSLTSMASLLDFACGCGRVTRFFARALGSERVVAAEIDPDALEFVGRTFGVRTVASAADPARVRFDRRFDAVFVGSLFSHLPRPRFVAWLRALGGVLADDGLLVFTTHGEHPGAPQPMSPTGFTFVPVSETARLQPDEYGSAFVRSEVVCELLHEAGLTALGYLPRELWNVQDVFVARAADGGGATGGAPVWPSAPIVYGRIERAVVTRPGHAWIGGGSRVLAREAPLREIRLEVDGADIASVNLGPAVDAPSWHEPRVTTEWYAEGDASSLAAGLHTVCAVATTATGRREAFAARALRVP